MVELKNKATERMRGESLGMYAEGGIEALAKKGQIEKFEEILKEIKGEKYEEDDYEIEIPKTATDDQISRLLDCMRFNFFQLAEVEIE